MEYTHGRRDNMFYREDEQEADRHERSNGEGHCFLPMNSSASPPSSALVPHLVDGSVTSSSTTPATKGPTSAAAVETEQMFAKVVTPSDVGKLNRLVIPKQHAEKYFPLDTSTHDKGLLLNFEERNGKPWRFRYSYWNSSQSYVMTKGWSRFVKEKHLDAGDTVLFSRGVGGTASDRLFIDWKKRPDIFKLPAFLRIPSFHSHQHSTPSPSIPSTHHHPYLSFSRSSTTPWAAGRLFIPNSTLSPAANYSYLRSTTVASLRQLSPRSLTHPPVPMVLDSVPIAHVKPSTTANHVRIFGVNLDQPREAANNSETASLLSLQLQSPLPSPELCPQGVFSLASFTSTSSTRGGKESQH